MTRGAAHAVWVLAFAVLALGCGSSGEPSDSAKEPSLTSSPSTPASGPAADAVADLATRLEVEADAIEVVSQEAVTWRDGSLGCAKPGFAYTQALVDGSRITLRANGIDYEYHSGGTKPPFWCEKPTE
jgi:hypothetical protein